MTGSTIISLFEQVAQRHPDQTAIIAQQCQLTFNEVSLRTNQLASWLLTEAQQTDRLTADSTIALCMERSEWTLLSMLAVLKAGAAYVPIDPEYPLQRKAHILTDSRSQIVLCDTDNANRLRQDSALNNFTIIRCIIS